jgi:hypothetical protein
MEYQEQEFNFVYAKENYVNSPFVTWEQTAKFFDPDATEEEYRCAGSWFNRAYYEFLQEKRKEENF